MLLMMFMSLSAFRTLLFLLFCGGRGHLPRLRLFVGELRPRSRALGRGGRGRC